MTNEKMEQRLAAALEKTAPDDVSGVLSRCEERKGTVIPMTTKKTTKRRWTSLIAACLAVMLLGGGLFYQRANAVASVVSLDVNPSIELKVNRSEKVLVCTPLNEDAKAILADMGNGADLKGAKLDVAVNAIVGSLVRNGYLNSISSAIMISVEDKDTARAEKLQRELTSTVDGVLQTSESRASVLTQTLTQDAVLEQQARENSISTGKAALVNRVLALNATLKFDALAKLSVEELKDLADRQGCSPYRCGGVCRNNSTGFCYGGGRSRTRRIPCTLRSRAANGMGRVRVSGGCLHGESAQRAKGLAGHSSRGGCDGKALCAVRWRGHRLCQGEVHRPEPRGRERK